MPVSTSEKNLNSIEEGIDIKYTDIQFRNEKSPNIYANYHESEIGLHTKITSHCLWMAWASMALLGTTIIVNIFVQSTALTVAAIVSGCIDLFSSISLTIFTKSAHAKQTYYTDMSFNQEQEKLIKLIENLEGNKKEELIDKLIDSYCDRRKK
ncbi:MAG: hypothetical protein HFE52_07825 [Clostridia bacterium]|nr:hypothetical protein [Clostridia bacterium]